MSRSASQGFNRIVYFGRIDRSDSYRGDGNGVLIGIRSWISHSGRI
jgi:hypothetical protein